MVGLRTRGFSALEFAIATLLVAVLADLLLNRLLYYEEQVEKTRVEAMIRVLQGALRIRMGQMMVESKAHRWADLADENPFDWLDKKPGNYAGECDGACEIEPGYWVYDRKQRQIAYRVKLGRYFDQGDDDHMIRLRLRAVYAGSGEKIDSRNPAETVVLEWVRPYRWF
ncbi:MAG: hypothetical protein PHE55_01070 [Methylococcaceae bacterium]|nr:hypothetical protein [Methylococcaceae bacterium]